MHKLFSFIKKERLYLLLAIFVVLLSIIISGAHDARETSHKTDAIQKAGTTGIHTPERSVKKTDDEFLVKRERMEKVFASNAHLAIIFTLVSLLICVSILLGALIDILLLSRKFSGGSIDIRTCETVRVSWEPWDVCRVAILFVFFGYMLVLTESALLKYIPFIKNDNLRMIINSCVLDLFTVFFILYFTVRQYKERLTALGVSGKRFFRNVFYGVVTYLATLPILVISLLVVVIIVNIFNYIPEKQPVVELFLKEKDSRFLLFTSLFAAVLGPVFEELFFRGFMYNAFKKYIGIFWSTLFTSAVFAALHTNMVSFVPILIIGIVLAYVYEKTGSLVAPITVHIIHNVSMVGLVFLVKQVIG